jgi:hypothetical protein
MDGETRPLDATPLKRILESIKDAKPAAYIDLNSHKGLLVPIRFEGDTLIADFPDELQSLAVQVATMEKVGWVLHEGAERNGNFWVRVHTN